MRHWLAAAWDRSVRRRALKMSVVVGSLLALINHGDALLTGGIMMADWIKIALTFAVPYCVSTISSVQAMRQGGTAGRARN